MARKLLISFKETNEDKKLYDEIVKHSNVSGYIKDTFREISRKEKSTSIFTPVPYSQIFEDEINE